MTRKQVRPSTSLAQLVVNFVIPIIVLTKFSGPNQLGPTKGMLVALAFPVAFEVYNVWKRRKLSMLSVFAVGGILVTGLVSLLGLGEGWLAVRRSISYFVAAIAILVSVRIDKSIVGWLLPQILDIDKVNAAVENNHKQKELKRHIVTTSYAASVVLLVIGAVSYVLTRIVIVSAANTTAYNQEYARLRILSLPYVTVPFLLGLGAVMIYFLLRIEKITGLDPEELLKKKL